MAGTGVHGVCGAAEIEALELVQRVVTFDAADARTRPVAPPAAIGSDHHRAVRLTLARGDGSRVAVALLRSLDWIDEHNAQVGGRVFLNMPEMGVEGLAEVRSIEPCPPLEAGPGRLVTGTFQHTSGEVYDLKLAGESQPLGVTSTHPFWSVDRNGWVSAIDLHIGERLKTLEGTTVVQSRSKREEPETVYNIEVEGDHVYRVGELGMLVHNNSPKTPAGCECTSNNTKSVTKRISAGGRQFTVKAEVVKGTENDKSFAKVCRIHWIQGRLKKATSRDDADVRNAMRWFLLRGENNLWNQNAAGHLIADDLGGPSSTWNLVPMNRQFNNAGGWKSMEKRIASCLEDPEVQSIRMSVATTYPSAGTDMHVPNSVVVGLTINGKKNEPIVFDNVTMADSRNFVEADCLDADWG